MKNVFVNFSVDEDRIVSVEMSGWDEYEYLRYVLSEDSGREWGEEEYEEMIKYVLNRIDDLVKDDGLLGEDDMEDVKECRDEMERILREEVDKEKYELGWWSVLIYEWGVEYDWNVGVLIMRCNN